MTSTHLNHLSYLCHSVSAQTCDSAEDSLEPTMPCLPSMSTPGVFIPALHIRVPENFVNIDAEWSVATGGAALLDARTPHQTDESRSGCDTTHAASDETVAVEAEIDMASTHEQVCICCCSMLL